MMAIFEAIAALLKRFRGRSPRKNVVTRLSRRWSKRWSKRRKSNREKSKSDREVSPTAEPQPEQPSTIETNAAGGDRASEDADTTPTPQIVVVDFEQPPHALISTTSDSPVKAPSNSCTSKNTAANGSENVVTVDENHHHTDSLIQPKHVPISTTNEVTTQSNSSYKKDTAVNGSESASTYDDESHHPDSLDQPEDQPEDQPSHSNEVEQDSIAKGVSVMESSDDKMSKDASCTDEKRKSSDQSDASAGGSPSADSSSQGTSSGSEILMACGDKNLQAPSGVTGDSGYTDTSTNSGLLEDKPITAPSSSTIQPSTEQRVNILTPDNEPKPVSEEDRVVVSNGMEDLAKDSTVCVLVDMDTQLGDELSQGDSEEPVVVASESKDLPLNASEDLQFTDKPTHFGEELIQDANEGEELNEGTAADNQPTQSAGFTREPAQNTSSGDEPNQDTNKDQDTNATEEEPSQDTSDDVKEYHESTQGTIDGEEPTPDTCDGGSEPSREADEPNEPPEDIDELTQDVSVANELTGDAASEREEELTQITIDVNRSPRNTNEGIEPAKDTSDSEGLAEEASIGDSKEPTQDTSGGDELAGAMNEEDEDTRPSVSGTEKGAYEGDLLPHNASRSEEPTHKASVGDELTRSTNAVCDQNEGANDCEESTQSAEQGSISDKSDSERDTSESGDPAQNGDKLSQDASGRPSEQTLNATSMAGELIQDKRVPNEDAKESDLLSPDTNDDKEPIIQESSESDGFSIAYEDSGAGGKLSTKSDSVSEFETGSATEEADDNSTREKVYDHARKRGVGLEAVEKAADGCTVFGTVLVRNECFEKVVSVHYSTDRWESFKDTPAQWVETVEGGEFDRFKFSVELCAESGYHMEMALYFNQHWDNNNGKNYSITDM